MLLFMFIKDFLKKSKFGIKRKIKNTLYPPHLGGTYPIWVEPTLFEWNLPYLGGTYKIWVEPPMTQKKGFFLFRHLEIHQKKLNI